MSVKAKDDFFNNIFHPLSPIYSITSFIHFVPYTLYHLFPLLHLLLTVHSIYHIYNFINIRSIFDTNQHDKSILKTKLNLGLISLKLWHEKDYIARNRNILSLIDV